MENKPYFWGVKVAECLEEDKQKQKSPDAMPGFLFVYGLLVCFFQALFTSPRIKQKAFVCALIAKYIHK